MFFRVINALATWTIGYKNLNLIFTFEESFYNILTYKRKNIRQIYIYIHRDTLDFYMKFNMVQEFEHISGTGAQIFC